MQANGSGSGGWHAEDAGYPMHEELSNCAAADDWLAPAFNADEISGEENCFDISEKGIAKGQRLRAGFPADDFISALESFPIDSDESTAPPNLDDLDEFFQRPASRVHSMRTAFSMNDLQSLQSNQAPAPAPAPWNPRLVSVKPSLASVPELPENGPTCEGGNIAVNLTPMNMYHHQEVDRQPAPTQHDGFAYNGQDSVSKPAMHTLQQPGVAPQNMFPMQMFPPPPFWCQADPGINLHIGPTHVPSSSYNSALSHDPSSGLTARVMLQPLGGLPQQPIPLASTNSPELQMMDVVKAEPGGWDTYSSDVGQGDAPSAGRLQPSGAAMRKSQSALELGAWKKIAQGDMEFLDPSGSVREQLQGLDFLQQVGKLTPEDRLRKILRYRAKRQMRNFNRTIKYQCRKSLADTRPRVRGRFARDNEPGSVLPHETKKAIREKVTTKPSKSSEQSSLDQLRADFAGPSLKTELAPSLPLGPEDAPGAAAGPSSFVSSTSAFPGPQPAMLEQHASLAQLYNQWSEAPAQAAQQQEKPAQDPSQLPEARILPCSSNSA